MIYFKLAQYYSRQNERSKYLIFAQINLTCHCVLMVFVINEEEVSGRLNTLLEV